MKTGKEGGPGMIPALGKRFGGGREAPAVSTRRRAEVRDAILATASDSAAPEDVPCLCGAAGVKDITLALEDRWGLPARNVLCGECGLIRLNPRWDSGTYMRIYSGYYWPLQIEASTLDQKRFDLSLRRAEPFAEYLRCHARIAGKSVVEIGCSHGAGLLKLKSLGAAKLRGYDYDARFLDVGRSFTGLDLRQGGVTEALEDGELYDVAVLRHVVEHLLNPVTEIKRLTGLLRPEGVLFIEVPGVFNCPPDLLMYFDVFHAYSFSMPTLADLMSICGFELITGDEIVYSLWRRDGNGGKTRRSSPGHAEKTLAHLLDVEARWRNARKLGPRIINKLRKFVKKS